MLRLEHDLTEKDRQGYCRVYLPKDMRAGVGVGNRVELYDPSVSPTVEATGTIKEMNRTSWILRVKIDEGDA
jgi:hypothetical protein